MNPLGTRARANELARLLEGAVTGPDVATAGYAALAMRLRALSSTVDAVPAPDFRDALRQRLLAIAAVQGIGATSTAADDARGTGLLGRLAGWPRTWTAQRRLALSAGMMAAVVALTGVGIASSRSLPGQPFYGMKRVAEGVQLRLANGDTDKGTLHLEFAATRLREVRALAHGEGQLAIGSTGTVAGATALGGSLASRIRTTLEDFNSETSQGRTLLERAFRSTGKKEPLRVLTTFARQQQSRLTAILPELPVAAAAAAEDSLELVTEVGTVANELLGFPACGVACEPAPAGPTPTAPGEPTPAPGATASTSPPTDEGDGAGGEPTSQPTPEPTPGPTQEPSPEPSPTPEPTETPSPSPTPSASPSPTDEPGPLLPTAVTTLLPEPVQSLLPTAVPTPLLPLPHPSPLAPGGAELGVIAQ